MNNDDFIISQLKTGYESAYRYIFDNEYEVMCRFAMQILHDKVAAESIVDDVVFSIWQNRESLDIVKNLRSYLIGAVRNRCINELKTRKRYLDVINSEINLLDILFVDESHPLGTLIEKELENRLNKGISLLPNECRIVFEKSRFEQKKYREIAEETGISINTVKYHIKQALSFLQEYMRDYLIWLGIIFFIDS